MEKAESVFFFQLFLRFTQVICCDKSQAKVSYCQQTAKVEIQIFSIGIDEIEIKISSSTTTISSNNKWDENLNQANNITGTLKLNQQWYQASVVSLKSIIET